MRRNQVILVIIPIALALGIGLYTTLSLPIYDLGPEKFTVYNIETSASDFVFDDLKIKYYEKDKLTIKFYIHGGDGSKDLRFEFICRDSSGDKLYSSSSTAGSVTIQDEAGSVSNTTTINNGDLVGSVLKWNDVPSGNQVIKAVIQLEDVVLDTWMFYVEMRNLS